VPSAASPRSPFGIAASPAVFGISLAVLLVWLASRRSALLRFGLPVLGVLAVQMAVGEIQYRTELPWWLVLCHVTLAAVLSLPLVLIAENNGYAYSTPTSHQMRIKDIAIRAAGYGIPGEIVDGNDVLAVYEATRRAVERARGGAGPTLLEAKTFRMKGHAEHDDAGYVPRELMEEWRTKDPIDRFERHLLGGGEREGLATREELDAIVRGLDDRLNEEVDRALASPLPPAERAFEGVYA